MNENQTLIRAAGASDIHRVACLHQQGFSKGLLGHCSLALIGRYYLAFLADPSLVFLVAVDHSDVVVGYILGGHFERLAADLHKFIRASWLKALGEIAYRPALWPLLWNRARSLFLPKRSSQPSFAQDEPFRLLAIAVCPSTHRAGIASGLIRSFESTLPAQASSYGLSVHRWNKPALKLYAKLGFSEYGASPESFYLRRSLGRAAKTIAT